MMVFGAGRIAATRFVRASLMTNGASSTRKRVVLPWRCMSAVPENVTAPVVDAAVAEAPAKITTWLADTAAKSNGTPLPGGWTWAAAAAGGTLFFRLAAMPLFFMSVRTGSKFQEHQEGLAKIGDMMQAGSQKQDNSLQQKAASDYRAYMKQHGLKQRYIFIPVAVQMPLFITIFQGLRSFAEQAHLIPGALDPVPWYHSLGLHEPLYLHLPDPYCILPTVGVALSLVSLRLNNNIQGLPQLSLTPGGMKLIFGSLATLFGLIAVRWPAIIQIALATGGASMVLQQSLLRIKAVRNAFGFWSEWPLSQEEAMARARRRPNLNSPMISSMAGMEPLFKKASALAAGHWEPLPTASPSYVGVLAGLHNPGAPAPPNTRPGTSSALAFRSDGSGSGSSSSTSPIAAAAAKGVEASGNAASAALGATPVGQQVLYTQRPKKTKK